MSSETFVQLRLSRFVVEILELFPRDSFSPRFEKEVGDLLVAALRSHSIVSADFF